MRPRNPPGTIVRPPNGRDIRIAVITQDGARTDTRLYYVRARCYNADVGRFIETDPVSYEDQMILRGTTPLAIIFLAGLAGCINHERISMTYEECASSRRCTVTGMVTARPAEHAWMGQLELSDGRCVSVSLPGAEIVSLRRNGPREMTVSGRVYGDPSIDREVAWLEIEGRRVGLGLCGGFFVFVRDK